MPLISAQKAAAFRCFAGASGKPAIEVIHRIPNGPVHRGDSLHWPLDDILAGLEEGLRKAAAAAPEGIASIAVDSWAVDYVRLAPDGQPLAPAILLSRRAHCRPPRKPRTRSFRPADLFQRTGAQPHAHQHRLPVACRSAAGVDSHAPWVCFPSTCCIGSADAAWPSTPTPPTPAWSISRPATGMRNSFNLLGLSLEAAPPIVRAGTVVGSLQGPLAALDAFRETQLIAPACHDTASAIAGIPSSLESTALHLLRHVVAGGHAHRRSRDDRTKLSSARYTNLGAAGGGLCSTRSSTACGCSSSAWMHGQRRAGLED